MKKKSKVDIDKYRREMGDYLGKKKKGVTKYRKKMGDID